MFTLKDNLKHKSAYYVILFVLIVFYAIEFGIGHYTNTLTLLIESYCTLCNVLGLLAVIIANKFGQSANETQLDNLVVWTTRTPVVSEGDQNKLRNTFGWKRYLTLSLLIRYVFLSSTVFSVSLEAIQTLIESNSIEKRTNIHLVFYVAISGLVLNLVFHSAIRDFINYHDIPVKNVPPNAITNSEADSQTEIALKSKNFKLKVKSMFSDFLGQIFIVIYLPIAYFAQPCYTLYADSILTLTSGLVQLILNFSLMKESCAILLQKIPDTIDIDHLRNQLLQSFPDVINIHDFHIWQLTAEKIVSTVHITFKNPTVYPKLTNNLLIFFRKYGIDEATIQPEFFKDELNRSIQFANVAPSCLMECQTDDCKESICCPTFTQVISRKNKGFHSTHSTKETVIDNNSTVSVKSMKVYSTQQTFLSKDC